MKNSLNLRVGEKLILRQDNVDVSCQFMEFGLTQSQSWVWVPEHSCEQLVSTKDLRLIGMPYQYEVSLFDILLGGVLFWIVACILINILFKILS